MPSSMTRIPRLLLDGIHAYTATHPDSEFATLSVLYIDVVGFSRFGQSHGSKACDYVLKAMSDSLLELLAKDVLPWPDVKALHIWDDGFVVLIPYAVSNHEHTRMIHKFVLRAQELVNRQMRFTEYPSLRLRYGLSTSPDTQEVPQNERLYELITMAGRIARRYSESIPLFLVEEFHHVLEQKNITSYYQPIVQLQTKTTMGWESLSRGPAGSELEHPRALFDCAERLGYLLDIERMCRNQSIRQAKLGPNDKLFINLSPKILSDPSFRQGETRQVIQEIGLEPKQIVFEITEHHAIDDYPSFLKLVNHYREQGYQIAIDDVGAGHSGLVTLMQVKPNFVKIDMELIRGIEEDPIKQDIVRAIHQISAGFLGTVIAEGIETPAELACIQQCGIHYGQGFLLGRPQLSSKIECTAPR